MEHVVIKIILLAGLLGITLLWLRVMGGRVIGRILFIIQFILGTLAICFPEFTSRVANLLGVGRGADLILYLLVLMFYAAGFILLVKFRLQERKITELARHIAILEKKLEDMSPPSSCPAEQSSGHGESQAKDNASF